MKPELYFAGHDVFCLDYAEHKTRIEVACKKYGVKALHPADGKNKSSQEIYRRNVEKIQRCQALVAHVGAFRSATEPDSGTCFEIGMACGLEKPVFMWMPAEEQLSHGERCARAYGVAKGSRGMLLDKTFGFLIEDFGSPLNLMLANTGPLALSLEEAVAAAAEHLQRTVG